MENRRNLSGVYYFDTFEGEAEHSPTCFEDCRKVRQRDILDRMDVETLKGLALSLASTIKDIGDELNLEKE